MLSDVKSLRSFNQRNQAPEPVENVHFVIQGGDWYNVLGPPSCWKLEQIVLQIKPPRGYGNPFPISPNPKTGYCHLNFHAWQEWLVSGRRWRQVWEGYGDTTQYYGKPDKIMLGQISPLGVCTCWLQFIKFLFFQAPKWLISPAK